MNSDQDDLPMSNMELKTAIKDMQEKRQASDNAWFRSMEKHARCALLPSPEKLDESTVSTYSPGSDETDTLRDFELIQDWVTEAQLLNTADTDKELQNGIENSAFGSLIQHAFSVAFAAMRNTASPELPELVFWYYAGHGLGKEKAAKLCYSSTPRFGKLLNTNYSNYNDAANDFVKEGRKVKGGELCLHEVGFCDLYGLLKPWIVAVRSESRNAEGKKKKNKHLVIILDSCHSGIIAQELNDFKSQTEEKDPTLLGENSVTVQAACGPDERTFGGYFTPCFVYLNDPKNEKLLSDLKVKWEEMSEESRNWYRSMNLPSPMVVTTRDQSEGPTMELTVQNFKLTLFPDPGFFKFCSIKVFHDQQEGMMSHKADRVLNSATATTFMESPSFDVLDYKLKPYSTPGPYFGTPMGLFLLEDPNNPGFAVCAHIHFQKGNTDSAQRINLVHHKKTPMGSIEFYIEDHDGLSEDQVKHNQHKIPVTIDANALRLIQACRDYVKSKEPGRWENVSRWNMEGRKKTGVNGKFRQQERFAWEDSYLEYIKQFNLPTVAKTDEQPI